MKTLTLTMMALLGVLMAQAKIVYLDNSLSEPKISENLYNAWTDAYAACADGDTMYVYGTINSYGDVDIEKKLTIYGPGYFLTENSNTQVDKETAKFGDINFKDGSQGSYISGIVQSSYYRDLEIWSGLSDLTIENCWINDIYLRAEDGVSNNNIQIRKNYILRVTHWNFRDGIYTNLNISNNIIVDKVSLKPGSSGIIANNLFTNNNLQFGETSSFEIYKNIYLNSNTDNFTIQPLPDAAVHHNISITGAFGTENNNFTAPESTLFIDDSDASTDGQYQLAENSPAKGAGSNGNDIGPFGGPDPYHLSGLPDLPNIYQLSSGGFVIDDELQVEIKIKQP